MNNQIISNINTHIRPQRKVVHGRLKRRIYENQTWIFRFKKKIDPLNNLFRNQIAPFSEIRRISNENEHLFHYTWIF